MMQLENTDLLTTNRHKTKLHFTTERTRGKSESNLYVAAAHVVLVALQGQIPVL